MQSQKKDGNCPKEIAKLILKEQFDLPHESFDTNGDKCFCILCHSSRGDSMIYSRGKPSQKYALPVEWVRFGLKTDAGKCKMNKVFEEWHVAFHGTSKQDVYEIFKSGLILLKPGDYTNGHQLGMKKGHIKKSFDRYNRYSNKNEKFDPNQIFVSPSIR